MLGTAANAIGAWMYKACLRQVARSPSQRDDICMPPSVPTLVHHPPGTRYMPVPATHRFTPAPRPSRQVALRVLFGTLITFGALVAASQLVLIFGLNKAWGLPNFWFAVGDDVVIHVVNFMMAMPMLVLMASMCPKGAESTVFALVTSVQARPPRAESRCSGRSLGRS